MASSLRVSGASSCRSRSGWSRRCRVVALAQPVVDHGGDQRALPGHAGLALDHRSDRDDVVRGQVLALRVRQVDLREALPRTRPAASRRACWPTRHARARRSPGRGSPRGSRDRPGGRSGGRRSRTSASAALRSSRRSGPPFGPGGTISAGSAPPGSSTCTTSLRAAPRRGGRSHRRRTCPRAGSTCPASDPTRSPPRIARSSNSAALGTTPAWSSMSAISPTRSPPWGSRRARARRRLRRTAGRAPTARATAASDAAASASRRGPRPQPVATSRERSR